ncbi:hypothetical protein RF11_00468 [Thelohanellus kitauei]|uniref:Uncharacterized protein n=1 Tax=Thelohanellus kitauei TaxID=669202 RepID=A0A0C2JDA7_THEKT|nr:hypothetical protein RF11_00468 [Thelohanellus kitauei]
MYKSVYLSEPRFSNFYRIPNVIGIESKENETSELHLGQLAQKRASDKKAFIKVSDQDYEKWFFKLNYIDKYLHANNALTISRFLSTRGICKLLLPFRFRHRFKSNSNIENQPDPQSKPIMTCDLSKFLSRIAEYYPF